MRRGRGEGGVGRKGKGSAQREERRIRFEFAIPCAFSKIREGRRKEGRRFKTRRSIGTSRYRVSPCRRSPYHFPASSLIETRTIDLPSKTEKKKKIKREMSGEHARIAITRRKQSFASEKILPNSNSNSSNSSGDDGSGGGGGGGTHAVSARSNCARAKYRASFAQCLVDSRPMIAITAVEVTTRSKFDRVFVYLSSSRLAPRAVIALQRSLRTEAWAL